MGNVGMPRERRIDWYPFKLSKSNWGRAVNVETREREKCPFLNCRALGPKGQLGSSKYLGQKFPGGALNSVCLSLTARGIGLAGP